MILTFFPYLGNAQTIFKKSFCYLPSLVKVNLIEITGQCARSILARMCHENFIWRELIQLMCCWASEKESLMTKAFWKESWQWWRGVNLSCLEEIMCSLIGLRMQKSTIGTGMSE